MTPLMHAAYCGHFEACQLLMKKGADVNNNGHSEGVRNMYYSLILLSLILLLITLFSTLL